MAEESKGKVVKSTEDNAMVVPEYLKSQVAGVDSDVDAMASSSMSIPRISLKGKKFRISEGGEEVSKSDTLKTVILAVEPDGSRMIKTFYAHGYAAGDSSPPDCSSSNGVTPDLWVNEPVSEKCSTCQNNVFGSATSTNGKKTKACKDSKRLWLALPDNVEGTVYALNVPVTSLRALSEYGTFIKKNGFPLPAIITEMSMDEESDFPQLHFKHVGFLAEKEFSQAIERHTSKDWINSSPQNNLIENKPTARPTLTELAATTVQGVEKEVNSLDKTSSDKW